MTFWVVVIAPAVLVASMDREVLELIIFIVELFTPTDRPTKKVLELNGLRDTAGLNPRFTPYPSRLPNLSKQ